MGENRLGLDGGVFGQIAAECDRQDGKWGEQDHSPIAWFAILGEEFGEVGKEVTKWLPPRARPPDAENYRVELIQLAAVAVRMVESFDRQAALAADQSEAPDSRSGERGEGG